MILPDLVLATVSLMQTGFGVLGNAFLLSLYTFNFVTGHRLRPIDSIYIHLSLANATVLLSKGIPQTMVNLGLNNFLDGVGCKLILFLQRVARSVSITTTCLLSVFQVITISASNSKCSELKVLAAKYTLPSGLFCWCFYLIKNFILLGILSNFRHISNNTKTWKIQYCTTSVPPTFKVSLFVILFSIPEIMCMGFMTLTSAYMMYVLQRHQQQVQHIHSCTLSPRAFPESRATRTILLLLSTYVSFYSINSTVDLFLFQLDKYTHWLLPASNILAASFPTISPFVLIGRDAYIHRSCQYIWKKKIPPKCLFPGLLQAKSLFPNANSPLK